MDSTMHLMHGRNIVNRGTISDGYSEWEKCARIDCDLQVVRPGKVQCRGEHDSLGCPQTETQLIGMMGKAVNKLLKKAKRR